MSLVYRSCRLITKMTRRKKYGYQRSSGLRRLLKKVWIVNLIDSWNKNSLRINNGVIVPSPTARGVAIFAKAVLGIPAQHEANLRDR